MLRIAICDDQKIATDIIYEITKKTFDAYEVTTEICLYNNAKELLFAMEDYQFDLLLLDIDMPEMDGIELGMKLRNRKDRTDIIFISDREDRVFDSLLVSPFGFIRKSRMEEDAEKVLGLYLSRKEEQPKTITMKVQDGIVSVIISDILYIEGDRHYQLVSVKQSDERLQVRSSMQELEEKLVPQGFLRVHKGFLVNAAHIKKVLNDEIILTNGSRVPVSRNKRAEIKRNYMMLQMKTEHLVL